MRKNERGATADAVGGGRGELLYDMACPDWLEPEPSYGRETSEEPEDLRSVNELGSADSLASDGIREGSGGRS